MDLATGHVAALNVLEKKHQRLKASVKGMFLLNKNKIQCTIHSV